MSTLDVKVGVTASVQELATRLEGIEETPQLAADLIVLALLVADNQGFEEASTFGIVSAAYPVVQRFLYKQPLAVEDDCEE